MHRYNNLSESILICVVVNSIIEAVVEEEGVVAGPLVQAAAAMEGGLLHDMTKYVNQNYVRNIAVFDEHTRRWQYWSPWSRPTHLERRGRRLALAVGKHCMAFCTTPESKNSRYWCY